MQDEYKPTDSNAFQQLMDDLVVVARATPKDKLLVTAGLAEMGKRVAVIGDGNNDVKSFSTAHVSICMGSGSTLAKQHCDMVLIENDFLDCMNSVMFGRNIYTNIKRFLQFQVTVNFSLLVTVFIGYCYLTESPLNSTQLLWINLIMDTFAALALSTMPPLMSVLEEPAIVSDTQIMTKAVWRQIYGVSLWNIIVMCIIIFAGKGMFHLEYTTATQTTDRVDGDLTPEAIAKRTHFTIIYNIFVWLQWFNEWNCRVVNPKEYNFLKEFYLFQRPFSGWIFGAIMLGTGCFQVASCKWLSWLFETQYLDPQTLFRCLAWGMTVLPVAVLIKLTPESWLEKMPVGISESQPIGGNTFIMRGYDTVNASRKITRGKKTESQLSAEGEAAAEGDKDDEFKQQ